MIVDTNRVTVLGTTQKGFLRAILLVSAMAIGFSVAGWRSVNQGGDEKFIFVPFAVFTILMLPLLIVAALQNRHREVTLAPQGIKDTNIALEFIPWHVVTGASVYHATFRTNTQPIAVIIKLKDQSLSTLALTRHAKWLRRTNRGLDGLWVSHGGIDGGFEFFFETLKAYARAHGGKVD